MSDEAAASRDLPDWPWRACLLFCILLLSGVALFVQMRALAGTRFGYVDFSPAIAYLEQNQLAKHLDVLGGTAPDPWQYRVLSAHIAHHMIAILERLEIKNPVALGFISLRFFQNVLILLLAALYYTKLGLGRRGSLLGLSLIAWGMTQAIYDSGASLDTYFDLVFYLLAALAILYHRDLWIVGICLIAACNRETSLLIPFMFLAARLDLERRPRLSSRATYIGTAALVASLLVFMGLRLAFGPRPLAIAYGNEPGFELLAYNVGRVVTWIQLVATVGVIPIIALVSIHDCPRALRRFFWVLVPAWILVHLFLSVMAETRLLLVPYVVAFIPAAIFGLVREGQTRLRVPA